MKACVIQPPYSCDLSHSDDYFSYKIRLLDECDESVDIIVLPEYSDVPSRNGDFGAKTDVRGSKELSGWQNKRFTEICRIYGCDGIFVGHCHNISTSVLYKGIRYTFGLKTGIYDYYAEDRIGATLITLDHCPSADFHVQHIFTKYVYGKSTRYAQ